MSSVEKSFKSWLNEHGHATCSCGHSFNLDDVGWQNGQTEEGTEWTFVEVVCPSCGKELVNAHSWYPGADNISDIVDNVLPDVEFRDA